MYSFPELVMGNGKKISIPILAFGSMGVSDIIASALCLILVVFCNWHIGHLFIYLITSSSILFHSPSCQALSIVLFSLKCWFITQVCKVLLLKSYGSFCGVIFDVESEFGIRISLSRQDFEMFEVMCSKNVGFRYF